MMTAPAATAHPPPAPDPRRRRRSALWSDGAVAKMKRLKIDEGLSYREIATRMGDGYTRGSVSGAAFRFGFTEPNTRAPDGPDRLCAAPNCSNIIVRRPGEKPSRYESRRSCSPECARRCIAHAMRAPRRPRGGPTAPVAAAQRAAKSPWRSAQAPPPLSPEAEAAEVARFLAERGITKCATKYVSPTQGALYGSAAEQAIAKVRVVADSDWKEQRIASARMRGLPPPTAGIQAW